MSPNGNEIKSITNPHIHFSSVYYLFPLTQSDIDQYSEVLEKTGVEIDAIKYIRRWK